MTNSQTSRFRSVLGLTLSAGVALGLLAAAPDARAAEVSNTSSEIPVNASPFATETSNGCRFVPDIGATGAGQESLRACQPGYLLNTTTPRVSTVAPGSTLNQLPLTFELASGIMRTREFGLDSGACRGTNFSPVCSFKAQGFVVWTWVPSTESCPYIGTLGGSYKGYTNRRYQGINWSLPASGPAPVQTLTGVGGHTWSLQVLQATSGDALRGENVTTQWVRRENTFTFDAVNRQDQSLCIKTGSRLLDNNVLGSVMPDWVLYSRERRIDVGGVSLAGAQYLPHVPSLVAVGGGSTLAKDGSWTSIANLEQRTSVSDPAAVTARELRFRYVNVAQPPSVAASRNGGGCRPGDAPGSDLYTVNLVDVARSRGVSPAGSVVVTERRADRVVPADATYLCAYQYLNTYRGTENLSRSVWLPLTPKSAVEAVTATLPRLSVTQAAAKLTALNGRISTELARPVVDQANLDRLRREAEEAAEQARQAAARALAEQQTQAAPDAGQPAAPPADDIANLLEKITENDQLQERIVDTRTPLQVVTGIDPQSTPIHPLGAKSASGLSLKVASSPAAKAGTKARIKVSVAPAKWAGTATTYLIRKVDGAPTLVAKTSRSIGAKGGQLILTIPKGAKAGKYQLLTAFTPKSDAILGLASFKPIQIRR